MAYTIAAQLDGLLDLNTLFLAYLWEIERTDSVTFRFTSHNRELIYDGDTYTPANGMDDSAKEAQAGVREKNFEARGVISSDAITHEDLRAGLFRGAKVTERLVDWRWPWAGAYVWDTYWIGPTGFSASQWEASVTGLGRHLKVPVGDRYTRTCRTYLGSTECGIDLESYKTTGTVSTIVTQRRKFTSSATGNGDDYHNHGKLVWTSGNNNGITSVVKDYVSSTGQIELQLRTPFDVQASDGFTVYAGCDRRASTCKTKFSNLVNFRGFTEIPGNDALLRAPVSTD